MRIDNISIKGFGKLIDYKTEFNSINLITGSNESGKSTLLNFIAAMFFGLKGGRTDKEGAAPPLKRYRPWHSGSYGGHLSFTLDNGEVQRISRDFDKLSARVTDSNFTDITSKYLLGRDNTVSPGEIIFGITEECFVRTSVIKQGDAGFAAGDTGELPMRLAGASRYGFDEVSYQKTRNTLKKLLYEGAGTERFKGSRMKELDEKLAIVRSGIEDGRRNQEHINSMLLARKEAAEMLENLNTQNKRLEELLSREKNNEKSGRITARSLIARKKRIKFRLNFSLIASLLFLILTFASYFLNNLLFPYYVYFAAFLPSFIMLSLHIVEYRKFYLNINKAASEPEKNNEGITDIEYSSLENISTALEKNKSAIVKTVSMIEEYNKMMTGYEASEKSLCSLYEKEYEIKQEMAVLLDRGKALDIAIEVLDEASVELKKDYIPLLGAHMAKAVEGLSPGRFSGARVDEYLMPKVLLPETGQIEGVWILSKGTRENVYIAMRLAMLDLLDFFGEKLPLFLDESFVYLDDVSLKKAFNYLCAVSEKRQIFYFSCRNREYEAAKQVFKDRLKIVAL